MNKRAFLVGILVLSAAACFAPAKARRYFDLQAIAAPADPPFNKDVFLDRVDVDDAYNDFRIVYRVSETEINYYSYEFWAIKPDKMIRAAIDHFLLGRGALVRHELEIGRGDPDWVLRCRVHRLEEVDEATSWSARLAMDLDVRDYRSGAILSRKSFDRVVPLSQKNVAGLPAALSRILAEELEAFFRDLLSGKR